MGLSQRFCAAGAVKLKHLVDAAGPKPGNTETAASLLGLRSNRHVRSEHLTAEEMDMSWVS